MRPIKVKELREDCFPEQHGDWVDLKAGCTIKYNKGEVFMMPLGVAMKFPSGYEGHLLARSSTFKKYNVIMANGMGIIDNAYCGNGDEWMIPFIAMGDGIIHKGERIAQFRAIRRQGNVKFRAVAELSGDNRGGFGSTGR